MCAAACQSAEAQDACERAAREATAHAVELRDMQDRAGKARRAAAVCQAALEVRALHLYL